MARHTQPIALAILSICATAACAAPPRVTHDRYQLELIAAEPEIVTPVGMAFDGKGRLLVIESHTHENGPDYNGLKHDRVRMLSDSDGDGRLDRWSTFAEGFRHAMNLLVRKDGAVYLVERGRILLLQDPDGDGTADKPDELVRLETEDDYPHNALGGIAQAPNDSIVVGLGENHGMAYRLIGADGKIIAGSGGQDGFFRMTIDGKNIERFAQGVWNPFGLRVLDDGRIFAVDNDPDASPPCRLLHVVEGGDYGYLYQYGRAGTHPLQCWNGELPGTLPMVCGVGEAPTAIVAHAGSLWVTSWGDHRIERYRLVPRGASYGAEREVVVQGDADFRPTGMAVAPDGSLYFGDWVLRDYPVHGKGRIWRLTLSAEKSSEPFPSRSEVDLAASDDAPLAIEAAASNDPFVRTHAVWKLSHRDRRDPVIGLKPWQLILLQAERLYGPENAETILRAALQDDSPDVRLYAVRWIADERVAALRDEVAKLLEGPQPSPRYYLAVLAAVDWLDHEPEMRGRNIADELLIRELKNEKRSTDAQSLALQLLSPDSKFLTLDRLQSYLESEHTSLRLEAVRSLSQQSNSKRFGLLAGVASDEHQPDEVRAEAIMGLAGAAVRFKDLLQTFAEGGNAMLATEAQRALRLSGVHPAADEQKPTADDLAAWRKLLDSPGDAKAGRRLYFSSVGPRCGVCHQHSGRGGRVGPDLTNIARSNTRERLITSILQPNQEIAPHYQPWLLVTDDGKTHTGLRMPEGGDDGTEEYVDSNGVPFRLESKTIEAREAIATSIMPSGLETTASIADLRDIVAFLMARSGEPSEAGIAPGQ